VSCVACRDKKSGALASRRSYGCRVADRIMCVQLTSGYDTDKGPAWITRVSFTRIWRAAYFQGRTLRRVTGPYWANHDSNFYDVDTDEGFRISGPQA